MKEARGVAAEECVQRVAPGGTVPIVSGLIRLPESSLKSHDQAKPGQAGRQRGATAVVTTTVIRQKPSQAD